MNKINITMMETLIAIQVLEKTHSEGVNSNLLGVSRKTLDALVVRSLAVCNRGCYSVSWVGSRCIEAYYVGSASKVAAA
jgi:hypothetical protein